MGSLAAQPILRAVTSRGGAGWRRIPGRSAKAATPPVRDLVVGGLPTTRDPRSLTISHYCDIRYAGRTHPMSVNETTLGGPQRLHGNSEQQRAVSLLFRPAERPWSRISAVLGPIAAADSREKQQNSRRRGAQKRDAHYAKPAWSLADHPRLFRRGYPPYHVLVDEASQKVCSYADGGQDQGCCRPQHAAEPDRQPLYEVAHRRLQVALGDELRCRFRHIASLLRREPRSLQPPGQLQGSNGIVIDRDRFGHWKSQHKRSGRQIPS
jgi:hypothetical protein